MTGELSNKNAEKLNKKMDEAFKKIQKISVTDDKLKKLVNETFGPGLRNIKEKNLEPKAKIELFNTFNKALSEKLTEASHAARHSSDPQKKAEVEKYKYIKAVTDSVVNKNAQLVLKNNFKALQSHEQKVDKQWKPKTNNKNEKDINKTIRNFEIKQTAKEMGKGLQNTLSKMIPSPVKNLVKSKGRGE